MVLFKAGRAVIFTKYHGIRDQRRKKMRHTMRSESQYPICDIWYSVKSKCATYESSPSSTERISSPPRPPPPPPPPHHLSSPTSPPIPPYQHCHSVVVDEAVIGGKRCWPVLLFLQLFNFLFDTWYKGAQVHNEPTNSSSSLAEVHIPQGTTSRTAFRLRTSGRGSPII